MATPYGSPQDFGGTDMVFANTGVRSQSVHPQLIQLSCDHTVLLGLLEQGAGVADSVTPVFLQQTDGAISFTNAIAFGANFAETDPTTQSKGVNHVRKFRKSSTLTQESLRDKRLGPAQDQKMVQADTVMRMITRDANAACYWSTLNANPDDDTEVMQFRGVFSAIDNGQNGYSADAGGNNTDGASFSEDNVIDNLLEAPTIAAAGFSPTDIIFPQTLMKYVNSWSGFYGLTSGIEGVLRGAITGNRGVPATSIDPGYNTGSPVSFHYERPEYLKVDPTDLGAGTTTNNVLAIHRPMWKLLNYEPGTAFWREPMYVGGYRWHYEAYRTFTICDLASESGGASMTRVTV